MTEGRTVVRIGNAQGFWGDRSGAAADLLGREPDLDYLTLDYLAEVSMSILAVQQSRDPSLGYARDILDVIRSLVPYWASGGRCKLITNAGGLNPLGCAEAIVQLLEEAGCRSMTLGVVTGDGVRDELVGDPQNELYRNLDTRQTLEQVAARIATANAYVGAAPLVTALAGGAEIVITGRIADPSMAVAPCVHEFGWASNDWNRLAGATIAGHLIECGTQVTGGVSTDWLAVPDPTHLGFPIVEVSDSGSCVVTKPKSSGGWVSAATVKEQLVYEIGDPGAYLSPDVTVSLLPIQLADLGESRVRVGGAEGRPHPPTLKVSATYPDGFRAAGTLLIFGRDAIAKARRCGDIVLGRLEEQGARFRDQIVECLGAGQCSVSPAVDPATLTETVLRIAVESDDRAAVEQFAKELMPLVTAGPQGTTGYAEGRPRVHGVFRYWPCLVDGEHVKPVVTHLTSTAGAGPAARWQSLESGPQPRASGGANRTLSGSAPRVVGDIAHARSGDKGTGANVGVIAYRDEDYERIREFLTADRIATFFEPLGVTSVERYEWPGLGALNFVLRGVLKQSLRIDAQGKTLGQALLEMPWTT